MGTRQGVAPAPRGAGPGSLCPDLEFRFQEAGPGEGARSLPTPWLHMPRHRGRWLPASPPPPTMRLIYAETHRRTLLHAAPHTLWSARLSGGGAWTQQADSGTPTHPPLAYMHLHTRPPPALRPFHQPRAAQRQSPRPPPCPRCPLLLQHRL